MFGVVIANGFESAVHLKITHIKTILD